MLGASTISDETTERRPPPSGYASHFAGADDCRPKLVVGPGGEALWHSSGAEILLSRPLPVRLEGGRLHLAAENRADGVTDFLAAIGARPMQYFLRASRKEHWVLLRAWRLAAGDGAVAIVCNLSAPCRGVVESGMVDEFGLTPAEARVLDLFSHMRSPKTIAAELDISVETVRSHLKRIFSKTSVESSAQLLQLTHAYCAS